MKKDFALYLKDCSKVDRKKVIKAAKSVGLKWHGEGRFNTRNWDYLAVCYGDTLVYNMGKPTENKPLYQMPQYWDKIQEALGIDVPKNGEVWISEYADNTSMLFRCNKYHGFLYNNLDVVYCHSQVNRKSGFKVIEKPTGLNSCPNNDSFKTLRKATPEEEAKLIEAEHSNGYYWTGDELVKIPEYVKLLKSGHNATGCKSWHSSDYFNNDNKIYKVSGIKDTTCESSPLAYVCGDGKCFYITACEPSTKQAYKAQESYKEMSKMASECQISPSELAALTACAARLGYTSKGSIFDFKIPSPFLDLQCPCYIGESPIKQMFDKEFNQAFKAGKSLADMVKRYGIRNAHEFIQKDKRIKELEEENEKLHHVIANHYPESDILRGFEKWELFTRTNGNELITEAEVRSLSVEDASKDQTRTLIEFIKE